MNAARASLLICIVALLGVPAEGADRVRAGQWETTLIMSGRTVTRSTCLMPSDAAAINGDAASIRAYVERVSAPAGCKVTDLKVNSNQVTVTTVCAAGTPNVGTTTYHGDSWETVNTNGATAQSKWVGACK